MFNLKLKTGLLAATFGTALTMASGIAHADADIAVQPAGTPTEAMAMVDICVVIPEILIFGVGEQDDVVSKIRWQVAADGATANGNKQTYSGAAGTFTPPAPLSSTVVTTVDLGATGSSVSGAEATLPVFLFANSGRDVVITVAVNGGELGAGAADVLENDADASLTIPITEITSGDGGSIAHPTLSTASTATVAAAGGVIDTTDSWTYTYAPATVPNAGTYDARISYTATQP